MSYKENQYKAYGINREICATDMKANIEASKYFEYGIYNDPVYLLKAVKHYALSYQESIYVMTVILDVLPTIFVTMQKYQ